MSYDSSDTIALGAGNPRSVPAELRSYVCRLRKSIRSSQRIYFIWRSLRRSMIIPIIGDVIKESYTNVRWYFLQVTQNCKGHLNKQFNMLLKRQQQQQESH